VLKELTKETEQSTQGDNFTYYSIYATCLLWWPSILACEDVTSQM